MKKIITRALAALALLCTPAAADQSNTWSPTTGTVSGLQLTTNYNNAFKAIQTCNSGATAPTNDISGAPVKGQCWLDTSVSPNILKRYNGVVWVIEGYLDLAGNVWLPVIGSGVQSSVASATTTDLCGAGAKQSSAIDISGTATITGFGSSCQPGQLKILRALAAFTLTQSGSLILPNNGSNIVATAGDFFWAVNYGGGVWLVTHYQKGDGTALNASANITQAATFSGIISPAALTTSTNDWNPAGLSTTETIRISSTGFINLTGITGQPVGRQITLQNVGSFVITLLPFNAASLAANQITGSTPYPLSSNASVTLRYSATGWFIVASPIANPVTSFANLKIFTDSGAPTTTLDITADFVTLANTSGNMVRLNAVSLTAAITTSGANGLDTGSPANNMWYGVYVIYNPFTNTTASILSVQAACSNVTLPSGFLNCFRAGWAKTDGAAHFYRQICNGRNCQYTVVTSTNTPNLPFIANAASGSLTVPTYTAVQVQGVVGVADPCSTLCKQVAPPTASRVRTALVANANGAPFGVILAPNANYGSYISTTNPPPCSNAVNGITGSTEMTVQCDLALESTSIYYAISASGPIIMALGWEDNI